MVRVELMIVVVTGIIAIAFLVGLAMANGIDGLVLAGGIGAISAIVGGTFTYLLNKIKAKKNG